MFTIDEFLRRVVAATAGLRQANGQVSSVPTERLLRWYQTRGLLDVPVGYRGRTALYGPRHVAQAVAIKRLQAAGRSLGEISATLAGVDDAELEAVSGVPVGAAADHEPDTVSAAAPSRPPAAPERSSARLFWRDPSGFSGDETGRDPEVADEVEFRLAARQGLEKRSTGTVPPDLVDPATDPVVSSPEKPVATGARPPEAPISSPEKPVATGARPPEGLVSSPEKPDGSPGTTRRRKRSAAPREADSDRHGPFDPDAADALDDFDDEDEPEPLRGAGLSPSGVRIALELTGGFTLILPPGAPVTEALLYAAVAVSEYLLPLSPQFTGAPTEPATRPPRPGRTGD